jgi:hypothetical protein
MKRRNGSIFSHSSPHHKLTLCALLGMALGLLCLIEVFPVSGQSTPTPDTVVYDEGISHNAQQMLTAGKQTFRFETFGSEAFWGDTLKLHEAVAKLSPKQALGLGLKVDADALPAELVEQIKQGKVNLNDPATTIALLKLKAVVGVTGVLHPDGSVKSIGINCALCHSTVDDSFAPGIGHRSLGITAHNVPIEHFRPSC